NKLPRRQAFAMIPYSLLDLSPIVEGGDAGQAMRNSLALAQHAEHLGYRRFWLAEHHNMPGIASAATAVLIGYVANGTSTIRVGSGGIMLPNHAPLIIAEQFGTLETLFPGRIDLGLGRGVPCDAATLQALRRMPGDMGEFPRDVQELLFFLRPAAPGQKVRAIPGEGAGVPVWILGSSLGGAQLAASLGLPFAFASHFAPDQVDVALAAYRARFVPSPHLQKPHVMLSLNVVGADTDEEARLHFSSAQQATDAPLPPPVADYEKTLDPQRLALIRHGFRHSVVGAPETVAKGLQDFIARYRPDEVIATAQIFDHAARMRSLEILSKASGGGAVSPVVPATASAAEG
ncbi:MAG TPA: LLM class flavin-dependent oxidoreductase, partial [Rhizomicrobium sp.]|nr:LLM class flavin-dependent oxidoreductase [Rhizomicrobium sp.]